MDDMLMNYIFISRVGQVLEYAIYGGGQDSFEVRRVSVGFANNDSGFINAQADVFDASNFQQVQVKWPARL